MKALTICQPYAELICRADESEDGRRGKRFKLVENRTWATKYRGPLAIHAGKSRKFLDLDTGCPSCGAVGGDAGDNCPWCELPCDAEVDYTYEIPLSAMPFGAVVAVCDLVDCLPLNLAMTPPRAIRDQYPWLPCHEHVEGPWCWILANVRRLGAPVPRSGAQGLWELPDESLEFRRADA